MRRSLLLGLVALSTSAAACGAIAPDGSQPIPPDHNDRMSKPPRETPDTGIPPATVDAGKPPKPLGTIEGSYDLSFTDVTVKVGTGGASVPKVKTPSLAKSAYRNRLLSNHDQLSRPCGVR